MCLPEATIQTTLFSSQYASLIFWLKVKWLEVKLTNGADINDQEQQL